MSIVRGTGIVGIPAAVALKTNVGRVATRTVAASDADALTKAHADYVCDGTDDQVEIQAAIDALPAAGGRVVLSEGTFTVVLAGSQAIHINKSNVDLYLSRGTTIKLADNQIAASDTGKWLIRIGDGSKEISHVSVTGAGTIDGNKSNNAGTEGTHERNLIRLAGPISDIAISGITLRNSFLTALWSRGPSSENRIMRVRVHRVTFDDVGEVFIWQRTDFVECSSCTCLNVTKQDGFEPATDSDYWVVSGCLFDGLGQSAVDCFNGTRYGVISNNTIRNTGTDTAGGAIRVAEPNTGNISIVGNTIRGVTGPGIDIVNSPMDIIVSGNVVENASEAGIKFQTFSGDRIDRISCVGNVVVGCGRDGIFVNTADNLTIKGNVCRGNNQDGSTSLSGIRFTTCNNIIVSGNVCYDDQATPTQQIGIYHQTSANNSIISNNRVYGNTQTQIRKDGTNESRITGNLGFVTSNKGTATINGTDTFVDITHGLDRTPGAQHIQVTPTSNLENATKFWVSDVDASTFRINVDAAPGEGNEDTFSWRASVE